METKKIFYDIHYHAYDLSHANLSAFIERFTGKIPKNGKVKIRKIPKIIKKVKSLLKLKEFFLNTLAVFEYPIEDHFLIIEYFLKQEPEIIKNNKICIGEKEYDKLVICPLMMDFGQKSSKRNTKGFYTQMPGKPISKQTIDLFNAIKNYYKYTLEKDTNGKFKKIEVSDSNSKPMVILPFLGVNPEHYKKGDVKALFVQYFKKYEKDTKEARIERAFKDSIKAFIEFDGRLIDEKEKNINLPDMFFGVKVYPPLGFNPDTDESKKLFDLCIEKKLPVTTHCSDTGFITASKEDFVNFTAPGNNWNIILSNEKYKKLKLNYAHFGVQRKNKIEWRKKLIEQMNLYPNVYSDISSLAHEKKYYEVLIDWLKENNKTEICSQRLLFGSDFIMNLLETDSYNHYLKNAENCKDQDLIENICTKNPEKFLFDTTVF